jgi:hypothetical protein
VNVMNVVLSRSLHVAAVLLSLVGALAAPAVAAQVVEVYKSPTCGCCSAWIRHMEEAGFTVQTHDVQDVGAIKRARGLPARLASCHTAVVDGYVIEGHVPASDVRRLLEERPTIAGLAVPGMPLGSPGMEGSGGQPFSVVAFDRSGRTQLFNTHKP